MGIFKKLTCEHEYYQVGEVEAIADSPNGWIRYTVIYCPKCKKEKTIRNSRYKILQQKQAVDKKYNALLKS